MKRNFSPEYIPALTRQVPFGVVLREELSGTEPERVLKDLQMLSGLGLATTVFQTGNNPKFFDALTASQLPGIRLATFHGQDPVNLNTDQFYADLIKNCTEHQIRKALILQHKEYKTGQERISNGTRTNIERLAAKGRIRQDHRMVFSSLLDAIDDPSTALERIHFIPPSITEGEPDPRIPYYPIEQELFTASGVGLMLAKEFDEQFGHCGFSDIQQIYSLIHQHTKATSGEAPAVRERLMRDIATNLKNYRKLAVDGVVAACLELIPLSAKNSHNNKVVEFGAICTSDQYASNSFAEKIITECLTEVQKGKFESALIVSGNPIVMRMMETKFHFQLVDPNTAAQPVIQQRAAEAQAKRKACYALTLTK